MAKSKGGVNKAQLVRDAVSSLGADAKPKAIQDYIKSSGGPEISTLMISSYKSSNKKKGGKRGRKAKVGRPAGSGAVKKSSNIIGDIATLRGLIDNHGKAGLLELIDAIA